jgi:hypothetical protein
MKHMSQEKVNLSYRRILGIHLHNKEHFSKFIKKIEPLIAISDEVWISSQNAEILKNAIQSEKLMGKNVETFVVDNKWHDWSGYLTFFSQIRLEDQLIVCNDSIVSRRIISKYDLEQFIRSMNVEGPALIGEVDCAAASVDLDGWSSISWISTYLFAFKGGEINPSQIESAVIANINLIQTDSTHPFNAYLKKRRPKIFSDQESRLAKLGAMLFERWLTRLTIDGGVRIVNCFAGSKRRRFEKLLERFLDA